MRAFLKEKPRSYRGMPPRPVVGAAVSVRLDVEPAMIEEFFGQGYQ